MRSPASTLARHTAALGGSALAAVTHGLAALRETAKPLHPSGEVWSGHLTRHGLATPSTEATGVAWIDEPGEDEVVVRLSRAIGLRDGLPDVHGMALRVLSLAGPGDLLFANTGTRRLTRFLLTASRDPHTRPMTTLLPYRTGTGPVLLRVDHAAERTFDLSWARPSSAWHGFATVRLGEKQGDPVISFDPLLHQVPGLGQYPAVRRLREPAYLRARRSRREDPRGEG